VAEEVAKVNPDLVARDAKGEVYTVRYEAVNAMLLNEFLKEHRKVDEQQAMIAELKSTFASQRKNFEVTITNQQKEIEALTVGLEKVSAQVGLNALKTKAIASGQPTRPVEEEVGYTSRLSATERNYETNELLRCQGGLARFTLSHLVPAP
jgi:hypothetical protein